MWEASGKHLESIWEASEKHLEDTGNLAGRNDKYRKTQEDKCVHCKILHFSNKNESVGFAWRFEGRCHQVPISTIEKMSQKAQRERSSRQGPLTP